MTDKTSDKPQDDRARPSAVLTTPANKRASDPSSSPPGGKERRPGQSGSPLVWIALVVSLAALGFGVSAWMKQRDIHAAHDGLSRQLTSMEAGHGQTDSQVQQLTAQVREQGERIKGLGTELDSATGVIRDLDEALRLMTDRGSELVLLNDVDHLVTIAQQQLELGGNVRNAIVALESAQAQLARANRPALAPLMQSVNGDLDRLRAASTIDIAAFSQQLEELAMLVSDAPLIMPDKASSAEAPPRGQAHREQPAPTVPPAGKVADSWWERALDTSQEWAQGAWNSLRSDLGDFIEVRRVDDASALLMSPDQAARFRESLRTRIMTAQLALMMRQVEVWRSETEAIVKAIETRYDESSPMTRRALRLARNMADAPIDTKLPTVANTLQSLEALREEQGRLFGGTDAEEGRGQAAEPAQAEGEPAEPAQAEEQPSQAEDKPAQGGSARAEGKPAQSQNAAGAGQQGTEPAGGQSGTRTQTGQSEDAPEPEQPASPTEGTRPEGQADTPEADEPQADTPQADTPEPDTPETDMPRTDTPRPEAGDAGAAQPGAAVPGAQQRAGD